LELKVLDTHQGLIDFQKEWEHFSQRHFPELFNSFIWNFAALRNFFPDSPFVVLAFYHSDELVGILPLCLSRSTFVKMPVRKYDSFEQAIGLTSVMVLNNYLEQCLSLFWDHADKYLSAFHTLRLTLTAAQFDQLNNWLKNLSSQGLTLFSSKKKVICLNGKSREDLLKIIFSKKRRHEYRRMEKRMREKFPMQTIHVDNSYNPASLDGYWKRFIDVYKKSWKIKSHRSISEIPAEHNFYYALFKGYGQQQRLFLSFMQDGERDIASLWSVEHYGKIYPLQITYNRDYGSYSPGTYLIQDHLLKLIKNGYHQFNYMGSQTIKQYFGNTVNLYYDINILNRDLYSQLLHHMARFSRKPLAPL